MFPFTGQQILGGQIPVNLVGSSSADFGSTTTGGSISFTYSPNNEVLFIAVGCRSVSGITGNTATYNSVSGTKVGEINSGVSNGSLLTVWRWKQSELPTSSGSYTLALTWTGGTPTYVTAGTFSCEHVDQTTPASDVTTNSGTNVNLNDTLSATLSNSLGKFAIGAAGCGSGNDVHVTQNWDPPSQMTEDFDIGEAGNRAGTEGAHDTECASNSELYSWTMKSTQSGNFAGATIVLFAVNAA